MMKHTIKAYIVLMFICASALVFVEQVEATAVSVWVGTWQSFDIPGDGSTNKLTIEHGSGFNQYDLSWTETYLSVCEGAPGYGVGTAIEDSTGLHAQMTFYCKDRKPQMFSLDFTYNVRPDTIFDGSLEWERISPRPW